MCQTANQLFLTPAITIKNLSQSWSWKAAMAVVGVALLGAGTPSLAQPERVMGTDISYWNSEITQSGWNTAYSTGNRKFVQLRATRGGTTGADQPQGTPAAYNFGIVSESHRYDDSRFVQNLIRATAAGFIVGPYHFARPDVAGNTGTDEADHLLQMAGAWMRPGYMMPMFDQEAGQSLGGDVLAQFAIDFSARIYAVMQIRPCIYINGTYSGTFQSATLARRDALAQAGDLHAQRRRPRLSDAVGRRTIPPPWTCRRQNPKDGYSGFYGPWDDYGTTHPWTFWQHGSTIAIPGFPDTTCDSDVCHGDIEYLRNYLIPAVWWNDSSGDWSTLANWNSGQTPVAPGTPARSGTSVCNGRAAHSAAAGRCGNRSDFRPVRYGDPGAAQREYHRHALDRHPQRPQALHARDAEHHGRLAHGQLQPGIPGQ